MAAMMRGIFGGGSAAPPPAPGAPPPPPTVNAPLVAQAAQNLRARVRSAEDIATSPGGLVRRARTTDKTLLGE